MRTPTELLLLFRATPIPTSIIHKADGTPPAGATQATGTRAVNQCGPLRCRHSRPHAQGAPHAVGREPS